MNDTQKNRLRTYAWNYFAYHAEQRMKTFHFYLIIVAALVAGFISAAARVPAEDFGWLSLIGVLIAFFSLAFAFIDKRNAALVRNGEAALKWLDDQEGLADCDDGSPHVVRIFARDDFVTEAKPVAPLLDAHVSYSHVLRWIFWAIGAIGLIGAFACLLRNATEP